MIPMAAASLALAPAMADEPVLRAARWIAEGRDPVHSLTTRPSECLAPGPQADDIEIGRAAFRTPLLLGGQAARAGLACDSCHPDGRRNADFFFPGLSHEAGTVDVTNALFSRHRNDGIDNPKPIPDLAAPKERLKINQAGPDLKAFIHGLIVEEFDGAEPPPAVLDGLVAYVRALGPDHCPANEAPPLRLKDDFQRAVRAAAAAGRALHHDDRATAELMIGAARTALGAIHERFSPLGNEQAQGWLLQASEDLAAIFSAVHSGRDGAAMIAQWLNAAPGLAARLEGAESHSLYNPERLAAALPR